MTLTEQVKILDDKIRSNKAQYILNREAAKISALSSGELEKYEYLTSEDLGCKPDVIQKAKFEYSPLDKVFNKGLDERDKKEGLLKRLKNIGKNEQQLESIRDQGEKQLDVIKKQGRKNLKGINEQEKQLKKSMNKKKELINKVEKEEKSEKIALLRDNLDNIFVTYDMNITTKGENILKKLANDEKVILLLIIIIS